MIGAEKEKVLLYLVSYVYCRMQSQQVIKEIGTASRADTQNKYGPVLTILRFIGQEAH